MEINIPGSNSKASKGERKGNKNRRNGRKATYMNTIKGI